MSVEERRLRSRLAQLVSGQGLMRGTLQDRERVCGKPNCRCTRGQKHRGLYLFLSAGGRGVRARQLYVPKSHEQRVRQWVANCHAAKKLINEISEIHWNKVRQRQE
jgi:hypothetical protein